MYSLSKFVMFPEDDTSFTFRLINAKTSWDYFKAFLLPTFQRPKMPEPSVMFSALFKISEKPVDRRFDFNKLSEVWMQMDYEGIRQDKKTWNYVIHILASRGLDDFLEDLEWLAPLLFATGGQKAIQETYEALRDIKTWWAD